MERITMNICTDGYRSHRNGILPYVPYGAERPVIMDVRGESSNGNSGHYVCDFAVFSGRTDVFLVPEGSAVTKKSGPTGRGAESAPPLRQKPERG